MYDYAVVGSGIGGSSIAAHLDAKGYTTVLFEKEPYLGGCSSTFSHKGYQYNSGATTLAGYQEGQVVKTAFDQIGFQPDLISTDPAIVIIQNRKTTPRHRSLDKFLKGVNQNYPHPMNDKFWKLVYEINQSFYGQHGHYYTAKNRWQKYTSLLSYLPMFLKFQRYLRKDGESFIRHFFGDLSAEYLQFMESQVVIVTQAPLKEINFFTAAIALGYTFNETYYPVGGFSKLFDDMTASIEEIHRREEITAIHKEADHYLLQTKKGQYKAKHVILNSAIYDNARLFDQETFQGYYKGYESLNNYQSSFMVYLTIKSDKKFHHHYQLIRKQPFPHTLSQALFVSFSDPSDTLIAPQGHYSITASIHTDLRWWQDDLTYETKKEKLHRHLLKTICDILKIDEEEIVHTFAATPRTFKHYINRDQLGGNAITMKNFLPKLPANDTPHKGLYQVGDTVYAAQGWPGVMLGVQNLKKVLNV